MHPRDTISVNGTFEKSSVLRFHPNMHPLKFRDGVFAPLHVAYYLNCSLCVRTVTKFLILSMHIPEYTSITFIEPTTLEHIVMS